MGSSEPGNSGLRKKRVPPSSLEELQDLFEIVSEGKQIWESTFDAIIDPVLIVSKDFLIHRANLAAAKSAQFNVRELIGRKCYEAFAKRDQPCEGCPMIGGQAQAVPERSRLQPFSDGREFAAISFPISGKDGQDLGMSVLQYHDFSVVRKLEEQLLQSEKMAALGLFASGIAHDINNPLSGVLAFAQLALQEVDSSSQTYRDLKEIESSALRCKKILEDILQFAKPSSKDEKIPIDLGTIVERVLPNLEVQFKELGFHLKKQLKKCSPVPVVPAKFEQVFANILCNALQALQPGGEIRIASGEEEKWVFVEIHDNGEGIAKDHLKKIFDPYFTTKGKKGGTGLGLPICYNIVREHGGHIEVKSSPGKGSTFRVRLPKGGSS